MNDLAKITQLLSERGYPPNADPTPLAGGEWSQAYAFTSRTTQLVVRVGQHLEDYRKDQIASQWSRIDLPIPKILDLGTWSRGRYAISQHVDGVAFDAQSADALVQSMPSLLRGLDTLRTITPPGSGFGLWNESAEATFATWRDALDDVANPDKPRLANRRNKLDVLPAAATFDRGAQVLHDLTAHCPNTRELIHADLLNGNTLVHDHRIVAFLDWGCLMTGDSLYDLAMLMFWAPWHGTLDQHTMQRIVLDHSAITPALNFNTEVRLLCYQLHVGLEALRYCSYTDRFEDVEGCHAQIEALLATIAS